MTQSWTWSFWISNSRRQSIDRIWGDHVFDHSYSAERMAILVSYAGQEDYGVIEGMTAPRRIYAIVRLNASSFRVEHVQGVPYQSVCMHAFPELRI